jgi:hypothetical protein
VPKTRSAERSPLEAALQALAKALADTQARWMIIGGIAVIAHGVQRMTTDIDAVVEGGAIEVAALLRCLGKHEIVPRVEAAEEFAKTHLVLLTRHLPTQVDLDLSFAWTNFERDALAKRKLEWFGKVRAPMAGVEALLVFKAIAARSRDADDTLALLNLHPDVSLARVRRRVVELAELADSPELLSGFDALMSRARRASSSLPQKAPPAKRRAASRAPLKKKRSPKR